ncbi:MAG: DUF6814 family protein [Chitinophagaceae bacterium]
MDKIKKHLGTLWIAMGYYAAYYILDVLAIPKFQTGKGEDIIAAVIYIFLVPIIAISLIVFGECAIEGEFSKEKHSHRGGLAHHTKK